MTSLLEPVDHLAKPPSPDTINPVERATPDKKRRQFKKALKEEMEKDDQQDEAPVDAVVIHRENDSDEKDKHEETASEESSQTPSEASPSPDTQEDESSPPPAGHIDVKA